MGYDIRLVGENGCTVEVSPFNEGSLVSMNGAQIQAQVSVTYNYSAIYGLVGFSMKKLDGKMAVTTTPLLAGLIAKLGTQTYPDYWAPTPGNAGHILELLLSWAHQHPEATWRVT